MALRDAVGHPDYAAVLIVLLLPDSYASDFYRRLCPQAGHQVGHLFQAVQAGHDQIQSLFAIVAVLLKQGLERVSNRVMPWLAYQAAISVSSTLAETASLSRT